MEEEEVAAWGGKEVCVENKVSSNIQKPGVLLFPLMSNLPSSKSVRKGLIKLIGKCLVGVDFGLKTSRERVKFRKRESCRRSLKRTTSAGRASSKLWIG